MLKKLVIALLAVVASVVVLGLVLSDGYRVTRTVTIHADLARVHELCGELKNWPRWAPWQENDPSLKVTYGATTTGVGATQSWTDGSGGGDLTLTRCDPQAGIAYDMNFVSGDKKTPAKSWMSYKQLSGAVEVEWGMEGEMDMPVVGPYLAMAADAMIGGMFQKGLDQLKTRCETP